MQKISHFDLCKKTSENFIKKSNIVLYEYNNIITDEFPDVLCYKSGQTILFEIKVNYQDFLKDNKKSCRIEKKIKYYMRFKYLEKQIKDFILENRGLHDLIIQQPHLGSFRYYVCPKELIRPEDVRNGWGLYWFTGKKFFKKKESKRFKNNIYDELRLLEHAFRKFHSGNGTKILIKGYK